MEHITVKALPPLVNAMAFKAAERQGRTFTCVEDVDRFNAKDLRRAFNWNKSEEGGKFWADQAYKLKKPLKVKFKFHVV